MFIPQYPPLREIELISVRMHSPLSWAHQKGIRTFFEHEGETILDQFAYRFHRPIDEYIRLIRGPIADEIRIHESLFSVWKRRIKRVPNQQPFMGSYNEMWFPRDAFIIVVAKSSTQAPYYGRHLDYEILVTVRDL